MKRKIKTTSFWLGVSGALVIILESLSNIFNVELHSKEAESIILTICSVLVLLGIVTKKNDTDLSESTTEELLKDINKKDDLE